MSKSLLNKPPSLRGFIALTSVIVIAAMLLVVVVAGSVSGFYERAAQLDMELKAQSREVASSCAQYAYLGLLSLGYSGGTYNLGTYECSVSNFEVDAGLAAFTVEASVKSAVTTVRVVYNVESREVAEYQEIHSL